MPNESPMRIRLSADRRASLLGAIKRYFSNEFDESMSDFRAEGLLELSDIEGDMFERESER